MKRFDALTSELCEEIDWLRVELERERAQSRLWREKYASLVESDIKYSERMIGGILTLAVIGMCGKPN